MRQPLRHPVLVASTLMLGAGLGLAARQAAPPQVTFRSAVELVDVEVSVLDRYRLPVRGLSAADFTILEDGKPRPIAAFASVDLPVRVLPAAKWMDSVAPDIHSNEFPREGRLVVILLDRSIEAADYPEARRIAEAAVNQLRTGDMAAIAWSLPGVPQNFTGDRERLLDVIRQPVLNVPGGPSATSGECMCGACSMEAIARIAEGIQDVTWRRKLLLFVGHRLPSGRGAGGCGSVIDAARKRALRAAEAGNLTIHVLDPRGVETLAPSASLRGLPSNAGGANVRRIANLLGVTAPTGGRHVASNHASDVLPEVFRESDSYYVLGFPPAYTATDGRFRQIAVKVNRRDVTLQARRGFYAAGRPAARLPKLGDGFPPKLVEAIAGLWPRTDVAVTLAVAPVAKPGVRGGVVAVVVRVVQDFRATGIAGPTPAPPPERAQETRVAVLTGAFDSNGRAIGFDHQTAAVTPRRIGDGVFEYEMLTRLELKPGRYEIRTAIEDSTTKGTGSAYTYIDVPDFAQQPVSLSGVFVQAGPGGSPLPGASLNDLVPVTPTTRREFAATEQVVAFVHEYQGQGRSFMPGYVESEIFDSSDTRVYRREQRILPVSGEHRALDFAVDVPLSQLSPGPYLLTIQVRHGNESARRDVRFAVR